jgi:ferritin-like metal-binding protein YciE
MAGFDEGTTSLDDLIALGRKVEEMADRVKVVHAAMPGAQATWCFEIEDTRFRVVVRVADREPENGERN